MEVDFKETIWFRVKVSEEDAPKVLADLKSGKIKFANDVVNNYDCLDQETLVDTIEGMTLKENRGYSTINAWETETHEVIFENGKA